MLFDDHVEVTGRLAGGGLLVAGHVDGEAEGVEHSQDGAKLSGWLACLELVDPLAGDAGASGQFRLAEAEIHAAAPDDGGQVSDRSDFHGSFATVRSQAYHDPVQWQAGRETERYQAELEITLTPHLKGWPSTETSTLPPSKSASASRSRSAPTSE